MPIRSKELRTASRYNKSNISVNRPSYRQEKPHGEGGYTPKAIILEAWNLQHSLELRGYLVRKNVTLRLVVSLLSVERLV